MSNRITREDIADVAAALDVEPAALAAVLAVECGWPRRRGFDDEGRLWILWERHICWRKATKAERAKLPRTVCNPRPGGYPKGRDATERNARNWARLHRAREVMGDRAYLCASYGLPQIMGFNHEAAGYDHVVDMVTDFSRGERQQLEALGRFLRARKTLIEALRRKHWARFAKGYNGRGYKENRYDEKLRRAYERFARQKWPATAHQRPAAPPPSGGVPPEPPVAYSPWKAGPPNNLPPPPPRPPSEPAKEQPAPAQSKPARKPRGGLVAAIVALLAALGSMIAAAWEKITSFIGGLF